MRIMISGASGLIGTALTEHLVAHDHQVIHLVRGKGSASALGITSVAWDPAAGVLASEAIDGVDAVINLSGAGIGDHRWTAEYKQTLLDSRLSSTTLLAQSIARSKSKPSVFLSGSAIGFYGARDDEILDESSPPGNGLLAELCVQWEAATAAAGDAGVRVAHLRTGVVLSPRGGSLKKQLPLFKFGLGGKFAKGRPWLSWISIDDHVAAVTHLLTADVSGPVNLTAPTPVTNAAFTDTLGSVLHRPTVLPIPSFGPKLILGAELADALLFTGQRVVPARLIDCGFQFAHPELEGALRALLHR